MPADKSSPDRRSPFRAGRAFREVIENDPDVQAKVQAIREGTQDKLKEAAESIAEGLESDRRSLSWEHGDRFMTAMEMVRSSGPDLGAPAEPAAQQPTGKSTKGPAAVRRAGKYTRGKLDEEAAIEMTKNPGLTYEQLAHMLGCSAGTLRDGKKCPMLAAARAKIQAAKQDFRGKDGWKDRQAGDDE
jgi:hypothetical protein